jgi:hypothetical protein
LFPAHKVGVNERFHSKQAAFIVSENIFEAAVVKKNLHLFLIKFISYDGEN